MKVGTRRLQHIVINLDFALTAKGKNKRQLSAKAQYIIDFQH